MHVFDYLLDAVQRRSAPGDHPPDSVLEVALAAAAPADADNIADLAYHYGRYQLAEIAWLQAYRAREYHLGPEHADTLATRASHANTLRPLERYAEYESEHRAIAGIAARVYGPEHRLTLESRTGRAFALIRLRRPAEAEKELRAVRDIAARALGPEHRVTMTSRHLRAIALHHLGRLTESEAENRSVLGVWTRDLGPESISTLHCRGNLAAVLDDMGRPKEAGEEARAVLDIRTRVLGPDHPDTAHIRSLTTRIGKNENTLKSGNLLAGRVGRAEPVVSRRGKAGTA